MTIHKALPDRGCTLTRDTTSTVLSDFVRHSGSWLARIICRLRNLFEDVMRHIRRQIGSLADIRRGNHSLEDTLLVNDRNAADLMLFHQVSGPQNILVR